MLARVLVCILAGGYALNAVSAQGSEPLPAEAVLADPSMVVEVLPPLLFRGMPYMMNGREIRAFYREDTRTLNYQVEDQPVVSIVLPADFPGVGIDSIVPAIEANALDLCDDAGNLTRIYVDTAQTERLGFCLPADQTGIEGYYNAWISPDGSSSVQPVAGVFQNDCPEGTSGAQSISVSNAQNPDPVTVLCVEHDEFYLYAWADESHLIVEAVWSFMSQSGINQLYLIDTETRTATLLGETLRTGSSNFLGDPINQLFWLRVEDTAGDALPRRCIPSLFDFDTLTSTDVGEFTDCAQNAYNLASADGNTAVYIRIPPGEAGTETLSTLSVIDLDTFQTRDTSLRARNLRVMEVSETGKYAVVIIDDVARYSSQDQLSLPWTEPDFINARVVLYDLIADRIVTSELDPFWNRQGSLFLGENPGQNAVNAAYILSDGGTYQLIEYDAATGNQTEPRLLSLPTAIDHVGRSIFNGDYIIARLVDETLWLIQRFTGEVLPLTTAASTTEYDVNSVWAEDSQYIEIRVSPRFPSTVFQNGLTVGRWLIDPLAD